MRCIEIAIRTAKEWLKQEININMRCIEILFLLNYPALERTININMRCIEILKLQFVEIFQND